MGTEAASEDASRWKPPTEGWTPQALADALKPVAKREAAPGTEPPVKAEPPPAEPSPKQDSSAEPVLPLRAETEPKAPPPVEPPQPQPQPQQKQVDETKEKASLPAIAPPPAPMAQAPEPVVHAHIPVSEPLLMDLPEGTPVPKRPAHEVLDGILRRKKEREAKESGVNPSTASTAESSAPDSGTAPADGGLHTALVPQQVTDPHEVQRAAMPGMGEMLARAPVAMTSQPDSRPLLRVPFVPVDSAPGEERRAWTSHLMVMGIVCFVLLDVLLLVVYKDEIAGWFHHGDTAAATAPASESATIDVPPAMPKSHPTETVEAPSSAANPEAVAATPSRPLPAGESSAIPAVPLPDRQAPPSVSPTPHPVVPAPAIGETPTNQTPSISAPADLLPSTSTSMLHPATPGPVPMAIPIPSLPDENPAVATPPPSLFPSAASPPGAATNPASLPVPPLPNAPPTASDSATPVAVVTPAAPVTAPMAIPSTEPPLPAVPPTAATPAEGAAAIPASPAVPRKVVGKLPAEAKSALQALENFLDAADWKARSAFVQKPDAVRSAMEKHAANGGDGPIVVGEIDFLERYPSKAGIPPYCMFEVSGGSLPHPVLTLVEQSPKNGVRVDWEAFTEFKDDLLLHFLEKKGAPPQKFRGLLRRKHYFDKDVPDIAGKDSFELEQPNAHFEGHVFVPRNSAAGKQLANQLPWGQDMPVIAELVWKSDAKVWWVQIENIVSYGWRG